MERQRSSFRGGALDGEFELFAPDEAVTARYTPRLIDRQTVNAALAPMREASLSSRRNRNELECVYSLVQSTGRGQGTCADNQSTTYRIVFD
jgi:hypothetical protein